MHELAAELRDRERLASTVGATAASLARAEAAVAAAPSVAVHRLGVVGGALGERATRSTTPTSPPRRTSCSAGDVVADRYRIEAVLGAGELGVTYRARDRVGGATVALKRMHPARVGGDPAALVAALRGELSAVRRLVHRNVVRVYDVGGEAGVPFVTMEYVDGLSLAALLRDTGPASGRRRAHDREAALPRARRRGSGGCRPWPAHAATDPPRLRWRAARRRLRARGRRAPDPRTPVRCGAIDFAAHRSSPAQRWARPSTCRPSSSIGEAPSASADLYAAGVVLYECVTGATPFRTDSPLAFLAQKLGGAETAGADVLQPSRPSRSVVAPLLRDLIARMIAPEADRRPPSAGALLTLIERAG